LLVGDSLVPPDVLDVVVLIERFHQSGELLSLLSADLGLGRRPPGELRAFGLAEHRLERLADLVEVLDAGPDAVAVLVALDIVGSSLDRRFQDLVGIAGLARIFDQTKALEAVAHAAARAEVSAIL